MKLTTVRSLPAGRDEDDNVEYVQVKATWNGGPYADLTWHSRPDKAPFEVLNVWDYKTLALKRPLNSSYDLAELVESWYLELSETDDPRTARTEREAAMRCYLENS